MTPIEECIERATEAGFGVKFTHLGRLYGYRCALMREGIEYKGFSNQSKGDPWSVRESALAMARWLLRNETEHG
jgi:hypothetical protein